MIRKHLVLIGLLLSIVSIVSYLGMIKPSTLSTESSEQTVSRNNALKIAIVNEDNGMLYNGQQVNIGELLTSSFASKGGYSVEVVSRSIAERGLENSVYQLMVVLPSKFSQDSLALESPSPVQAVFQYHIKSDKNHLVKQAEQAVIDLKNRFNQDLIHVYFLSIIGNLQTAQEQVGNVVSANGRVLNAFDTNLSSPLTMYSRQFTGVSSSPTELLSAYTSFQKGLLGSNDAFSSMIDVNKVYTTELEQIKSLQEQWQESLLKREASLTVYDGELSKLSVAEQLNQLIDLNGKMAETHSNPQVLSDTKTKAEELQSELTTLIARLEELNGNIDEVLSTYDAKITTAVEASLRQTDSYNLERQATTLGTYLATIESMLVNRFNKDIEDFSGYEDSVIDGFLLSEEDKQYLKNLNTFIRGYTQTQNLPAPNLTKPHSEQEQHLRAIRTAVEDAILAEHQLTVTVSEGKTRTLELIGPEGYELEAISLPVIAVNGSVYTLEVGDPEASSHTVSYKMRPTQGQEISLLTPLRVDLLAITEEKFEYKAFDSSVPNPPSSSSSMPSSDSSSISSSSSQTEETTPSDASDSGDSSSTGGTDAAGPSPTTADDASSATSLTSTEVTYRTEKKIIERRFTKTALHSPYKAAVEATDKAAEHVFLSDFQAYLKLSALVETYYGYQITGDASSLETTQEGGLIGDISAKTRNPETLKAIIINLIKDATVTELKNSLKFSQEDLESFAALLPQAEELSGYTDTLQGQTTQLLEELSQLVQSTQQVNDTLANKPEFVEQEKRDNTDLVTVSMSINSDLEKLKAASQTLMDNTKSHQLVSESIQGQVDRLATDVKTLETEGNNLSGRVEELYGIMSREYGNNAEFLKAFSTVLSNTKVGNGQNNAVYDYLSNPLDSSKIESLVGTVIKQADTRQDERSGFLLILMSYLVGLAVSYILQQSDRAKWPKIVEVVARRHWTNSLYPFIFLTGVAFLAAVIIGGFAGYRLTLSGSQMVLLMMLLAVLTQFFAHGISHLNQYLKSYGFLVSLFLIMMYLISAGQLLDSHYVSHSSWVSVLSPLTYLEGMLTAFLNNKEGWTVTFIITLLLAGAVSGLTIYRYQDLDESGV